MYNIIPVNSKFMFTETEKILCGEKTQTEQFRQKSLLQQTLDDRQGSIRCTRMPSRRRHT